MSIMLTQLLIVCCFGFIGFIETSQVESIHNLDTSNFLDTNGLTTVQNKDKLGIKNGESDVCYTAYLHFVDQNGFMWTCTGTLVAPKIIVTAKHCIAPTYVVGMAVMGVNDVKEVNASRAQVAPLSPMKELHPSGNIGVLHLITPVKLNEYVCTVKVPECSATKEDIKASDEYIASGWGITINGDNSTAKLISTRVFGVGQKECTAFYKVMDDKQMCTTNPGNITCLRDSGGPLVRNGTLQGLITLPGIATCALPSAPVFYLDLNCYISWLCNIINRKLPFVPFFKRN